MGYFEKYNTSYFYKFDEMKTNRKAAAEGEPTSFRRLSCFGDSLSGMMCDFDVGFTWKPHSHPHEQLTICFSGAVKYTIGDETVIMHAGDTAYVPANVQHYAVCLEAARMMDVFTPVRLDQMKYFIPEIDAECAFNEKEAREGF